MAEQKIQSKEYYLSNRELRQVQLIELELLQEADRICRKCGIHYNIIAGTLLGAVRHNGFIPWDDDADIALLRTEYERFREACEKELDHERYYFQDHVNTPGYRWGYGKLRRRNTTFLRIHQEHMPYEQGIFIDVFPLDAVSDIQVIRSIQNFHWFCVRKVLWSEVGKIAEKKWWKRQCYRVLSAIPDEKIWKHYHKYSAMGNWKKTQWVRILTFPTPNRCYAYRRRWYEASSDIRFEGYCFQGIRDFDDYLIFKFGSYKELPPEGHRKTHPVSRLRIFDSAIKFDK